jgi:hypothetical protein
MPRNWLIPARNRPVASAGGVVEDGGVKNPFVQASDSPSAVRDRLSRIQQFAKLAMAIVAAALFHAPQEAGGQTAPSLYQVKLAWKESPSPDVIGYRVQYGTASGDYTASIVVGNVTKATVPGLESGTTYFLVVSAIDSNGEESDVSNEVRFLPGLHETKLRLTAGGGMVLTVRGLIGRRYDIEATEDLKTWAVISTVILGDSGSASFSDPDAVMFPKRFYRTRETQ